jgi:hypothetical protein
VHFIQMPKSKPLKKTPKARKHSMNTLVRTETAAPLTRKETPHIDYSKDLIMDTQCPTRKWQKMMQKTVRNAR